MYSFHGCFSVYLNVQEGGMRLGILINDREYREALAEKISSYDNDIFVNILDGKTKDSSGSLILTDIRPEDVESGVLEAIKARTVFLTDCNEEDRDGCYRVFKYDSVTNIVSELSLAYNEWHGTGSFRNHTSRLISALCETDAYSAARCSSLARQIIYRHGGKVLILPLSYINEYGKRDNSSNTLSRLLYSIHTGRERSPDSFTYTDSYGVSMLLLQPGLNPIAYLEEDELLSLTYGLAGRFDTIICDVGTCFRSENLTIMKGSDRIVYFGTGRRFTDPETILGTDACKKLIRIKLTGEADEAMAIDDCIKQIYVSSNNENDKNGDDRKIRS